MCPPDVSTDRSAPYATVRPGVDLAAPPPGKILVSVAERVDEVLSSFLTERAKELASIDAALNPVADSVRTLVEAGGKRLRPAFVWWGAMAAGAAPDAEILKPAGAAELLHTFALIHDDIMDKSATRRGLPAVHTLLAEHHREAGMAGDAEWFGTGGGILAGDMVFVWADILFEAAALDPVALARSRTIFAHLRTEVMAGQYLDLRLSGLPEASEEDSLRVSLLKSGRYTVTRPLQMGAALGAPDADLDRALVAFGDAIGVAFQLRDDILGLMGNPHETGKGALEDVREGKRTMLVLRARDLASPDQRRVLSQVLGDSAASDEGVDRVRQIVVETGALDQVEGSLRSLRTEAESAIDDLREPARSALLELAAEAIDRRS